MTIKVFISYSRKDEAAVSRLVEDLERSHVSVWHDAALHGGHNWWQAVLQHIRSCDVFVLAVSQYALASKPCRAELRYARDLGLPVLPVQIGPVESLRTAPVADLHVLDYRQPTAANGLALFAALSEAAGSRRELPDPLPPSPPVPFAYLLRLRSAIDAEELTAAEQAELIRQLRDCLETEDDDSVKDDARELLIALRRRPDVTYRNGQAIDQLLTDFGLGTPPPPPPPDRRHVGSGSTPERSRRGSRIPLLAAAAVLAVALLVTGGIVLFRGDGETQGGDTASSRTAQLSTTDPTTTDSATTEPLSTQPPTTEAVTTQPPRTLVPTPPPPSPVEQLLAIVPGDFDPAVCTPGPLAGDGDVARVDCGASATQPGPTGSTFNLYPDNTVDGVFLQDTVEFGLAQFGPGQFCPTVHGYGDYSNNGRYPGRVACWVGNDNTAYLLWTQTEFGAEGFVSFYNGGQPGLQALWDWWVDPSRSDFG
ncbi:toll/interleukin-1 receptor domain-containing protein [Geodermatophilus sp. SYSU D00703]